MPAERTISLAFANKLPGLGIIMTSYTLSLSCSFHAAMQ
jgi:hypothetical protein